MPDLASVAGINATVLSIFVAVLMWYVERQREPLKRLRDTASSIEDDVNALSTLSANRESELAREFAKRPAAAVAEMGKTATSRRQEIREATIEIIAASQKLKAAKNDGQPPAAISQLQEAHRSAEEQRDRLKSFSQLDELGSAEIAAQRQNDTAKLQAVRQELESAPLFEEWKREQEERGERLIGCFQVVWSNYLYPAPSQPLSLKSPAEMKNWVRAVREVLEPALSILARRGPTVDRLLWHVLEAQRDEAADTDELLESLGIESVGRPHRQASTDYWRVVELAEDLQRSLVLWSRVQPKNVLVVLGLAGGALAFVVGVVYPLTWRAPSTVLYLYFPVFFYMVILVWVVASTARNAWQDAHLRRTLH